MKNSYLFLMLFLLFIVQPIFGQLTPEQAIVEMGRGINLGNTLEPPFEGSWNNGPAQESYFDAYETAGFSNIRIPVRWDQHTGNTAPYTINENWMDRVEQVVDWGLERGFMITLNGHHEDWLKNNYTNQNLRARYDAIWTQIAERFQNKSDRLLFEIINEPNGMTVAQVDDLNQRILDIIRVTNPTRIVIFGGNMYANAEQLFNAAIPQDEYLIGYYHAYDPWQFSGQGMGTWGTPNDYQQLTNKYQSVKNWSVANNIPVHHSEFGAIHSCDYNSRMRIYAHNVEQCIAKGFAFSVWDDGGDFRVLNRGNNTWPEVKDILMHYHEDSPNQIFSSFTPDPITEEPAILVEWNNRVTGNSNIILERSLGNSNNFVQIAELPATANAYTDLAVAASNTYTYRMYTTRADGTLLHGYPTRIRINATVQSPFNGDPINIPGELEVEEYDFGGEGLAYHDNEASNIPNGFRTGEGVDIGALGDGFILEYVAIGEWIKYTVNVTEAGIYSVKGEVASEVSNGAFSIGFEQNGSSTSFHTPSTGGWYDFQEISANNTIELAAGEQEMRLDITNDNPFNLDKLTFTLETSTNLDALDNIKHEFTVSPNPTNEFINIKLSESLANYNNRLEVFTITGKKVATFQINSSATQINLRDFDNGFYFLRLVNDDLNLVERIMKF